MEIHLRACDFGPWFTLEVLPQFCWIKKSMKSSLWRNPAAANVPVVSAECEIILSMLKSKINLRADEMTNFELQEKKKKKLGHPHMRLEMVEEIQSAACLT